jgi:hypothetical protein
LIELKRLIDLLPDDRDYISTPLQRGDFCLCNSRYAGDVSLPQAFASAFESHQHAGSQIGNNKKLGGHITTEHTGY